MEVMSWNVDGTFPPAGSADSVIEKIEWLDSRDTLPDILLLQEINPNQQEQWHELLLEQLEYSDLTDTIGLARELDNSNGHITAVNGGWNLSRNKFRQAYLESENGDSDDFETSFPEKILVTDIDHPQGPIEIWNIRAVPGSQYGVEKLKILELAYNWIQNADNIPRILAGDLNTPKAELSDGQAVTFGYERDTELQDRGVTAELKILKGLGHFGIIDVFRAQHGYGDIQVHDESHNGKRFDHLFASEELSPNSCRYVAAGRHYSDHVPVVATFDP